METEKEKMKKVAKSFKVKVKKVWNKKKGAFTFVLVVASVYILSFLLKKEKIVEVLSNSFEAIIK